MALLCLPKLTENEYIRAIQAKQLIANGFLVSASIWEANDKFHISFFGDDKKKFFRKVLASQHSDFREFTTVAGAVRKIESFGLSKDKIRVPDQQTIVLPTENTHVQPITVNDLIAEARKYLAEKDFKQLALTKKKIERVEVPLVKQNGFSFFFSLIMNIEINDWLSLNIGFKVSHVEYPRGALITITENKIYYFTVHEIESVLKEVVEQWLNTPFSYRIEIKH